MSANPSTGWQRELAQGLESMGLVLDEQCQRQALDYLALLMKWNRSYNLTAIRDPAEAVSRQLLDSYSILELIQGERVLDVGTGPGLPGIPLAIALKQVQFTLLDSNGKKTRFVQQAISTLKLDNVSLVQGRVESFQPDHRFDTVTARAFADLQKLEQLSAPLVADRGIILAMVGHLPRQQMQQLEHEGYRVTPRELTVPGTLGERNAVILQRA